MRRQLSVSRHSAEPGPQVGRVPDLETGRSWVPAAHGRRWTPSCLPTRPPRPWISSGDSWCLPQTNGSAQPRRWSTPMCRGREEGAACQSWGWVLRLGSSRGACLTTAPASLVRHSPCGPHRFHCPAHEWTLEADVRLPVHEGVQLTAPEYRDRLYQVIRAATLRGHCPPQRPLIPSTPLRTPLSTLPLPQMILERRGNCRIPKRLGDGPLGAERSAQLPQEHPLKPRAAPLLPSGCTAQDPGHRPQNSPDHAPVHGV